MRDLRTPLPRQITEEPGIILHQSQIYRVGITKHGHLLEDSPVEVVLEYPCGSLFYGTWMEASEAAGIPRCAIHAAALAFVDPKIIVTYSSGNRYFYMPFGDHT